MSHLNQNSGFGHTLTHLLCQHGYISEYLFKVPFFVPTQSLCWHNIWVVPWSNNNNKKPFSLYSALKWYVWLTSPTKILFKYMLLVYQKKTVWKSKNISKTGLILIVSNPSRLSLVFLLISNLISGLRLHQFLETNTTVANKSLLTDANGAYQ